MPQIPPTGISVTDLDSDVHAINTLASHLSLGGSSSGPTPDPDLDDVVLISPDNVGVVSSLSPTSDFPPAPRRSSFNHPRINLRDISLHSPSSIVGTPFDFSSPRFEYPFPSAAADPEITVPSTLPPTMSTHYSTFQASIVASMPHFPIPSVAFPRSDARSHPPAHSRLHAPIREPPIPPSLAKKKRWSLGLNVTPEKARPEARRRSSSTRSASNERRRGTPSRTFSPEVAEIEQPDSQVVESTDSLHSSLIQNEPQAEPCPTSSSEEHVA